ncbi:ribulose 1,5-bisphosphate carboxylase [archaeon SCG-AAA382B04]|nr:ribulose 1,5-bisphosphate carboxylase [archaeon SCG-AAA382B04]
MSDFRNFRVIDLELPKRIVSRFNGPNFGIEGVRKILETEKSRRPHLGTIVKPNVGLTPSEFQDIVYEAAAGGVDFVKDDELLVDPDYCPIEERAAAASEALDRGEDETGRRALYACNITDRADRIVDTAQDAIDNGAPCLMVNVITAGFSALRALAEANLDVPIHVHRNFHAAFTRDSKHGVKMRVIAKLVRMAGGDQLHTGTAAGKMEGQRGEVRMINDFLRGDWHGLKTTFPVASGGIHPGLVKRNIEVLGNDIVIQAGGGIHGHPDGTRSGAKAMRQAIESSMKGRSIEDYAETHEELKKAIEYWGTA